MKTKILFLMLFLLSVNLIGQEVKDSTSVKLSGHKNVVKFLPENLVFNSVSFELTVLLYILRLQWRELILQ